MIAGFAPAFGSIVSRERRGVNNGRGARATCRQILTSADRDSVLTKLFHTRWCAKDYEAESSRD